MENFFVGLLAKKSNKLAGSGQNPTAIGNLGDSLSLVKDKMELPTELSVKQLIKLEEEKGKMDAELKLADQIISSQEELLGGSVALHGKNIKWASIKMKADQKLREMESGHKQEISGYMLGAARTQAYTDGYIEALEVSAEIFG